LPGPMRAPDSKTLLILTPSMPALCHAPVFESRSFFGLVQARHSERACAVALPDDTIVGLNSKDGGRHEESVGLRADHGTPTVIESTGACWYALPVVSALPLKNDRVFEKKNPAENIERGFLFSPVDALISRAQNPGHR